MGLNCLPPSIFVLSREIYLHDCALNYIKIYNSFLFMDLMIHTIRALDEQCRKYDRNYDNNTSFMKENMIVKRFEYNISTLITRLVMKNSYNQYSWMKHSSGRLRACVKSIVIFTFQFSSMNNRTFCSAWMNTERHWTVYIGESFWIFKLYSLALSLTKRDLWILCIDETEINVCN